MYQRPSTGSLLTADASLVEVIAGTGDICACPRLQAGQHYLLGGHVFSGQLILTEEWGLAVPFKKRYRKRLPGWLELAREKQ